MIMSAIVISIMLSGCDQNENQKSAKRVSDIEPQVSVQLWSVKDEVKRDFEGTLTILADMGFDGVEFAGEFGEYSDNPRRSRYFLMDWVLTSAARIFRLKN